MKIYYLSLIFSSLIVIPTLFALDEDTIAENTDLKEPVSENQVQEIDICEKYSLEKDDELRILMNNLSDEEFIRILFLSKQLEKDYPLYLCEIDKVIDRCFKQNKKRLNFSNAIRALKAVIFFGCSIGSGYIGFNGWSYHLTKKDIKNGFTVSKQNFGICLSVLISALFGWQGISELEKIGNNFDQNQLLYKAIAIKNALLLYQKK